MKHNKLAKNCVLLTWSALTFYLFLQASIAPKSEVFFSPDDKPKYKLIDLIKNTDESIRLAVYTFTNRDLAKALVQAKQRGIKIEVITDKNTLVSKHGQIEQLRSNGINVLVYPVNENSRTIMHHKFALFKKVRGKEQLCTGSLNWTHAACRYNQENILVTDNKSVYDRYDKQFDVLKLRCLDKLLQ